MRIPGLILLWVFLLACSAGGADFYAASSGPGAGSSAHPWSLTEALEQSVLKPGDTLWLRGGVYTGAFVSKLNGAPGLPITVRARPRERVTLDGPANDATRYPLTVEGSWVVFQDLEIIHSATWPADALTPVAVQCKGRHIRLLNLIIHDAGQGVGAWMEATDLEISGCLIYHNGQRSLEHGIYAQNDGAIGTKLIRDNIIFNNAGFGIHAYTQQGQLSGFAFDGNILFNNGAKQGGDTRYDALFVGGEPPADQIVVRSNYTFFSEGVSRPNLRFSMGDHQQKPHGKLWVTDNYIVGGIGFTAEDWQQVTFTNNVLVNWAARLTQTRLPWNGSWSAYTWDLNRYYGPAVFGVSNQLHWSLNAWQGVTGLDKHSQHTQPWPTHNEVFVRPNPTEPSRAHVVVYNWEKRPRVTVRLNSILKDGQPFEVRNAQDYFGQPVQTGTFDGQPVSVPTTNLVIALPRNGAPQMPVTTPLFNVYVVVGLDGRK